MVRKNAPSNLCSGKIVSCHIVLDFIHRLLLRANILHPNSEPSAIRTLEQILIQVHENIDCETDVHIHMTLHKLRKGGHVRDHPTIFLSCSTVKDAAVTSH